MHKKSIPFIAIIVIAIVIVMNDAFSPHFFGLAEGMEIGRFRCVPSLITRKTFDDNVYLTKYDREETSFTTILPSLSIAKTGKIIDLTLSYQGDFRLYNEKYSDENRYNQTGSWNIGLKPTSKLGIDIKGRDTYSYAKRDERRELFKSNNNLAEYNDLSSAFDITQKIGKKWRAKLTYLHDEKNYRQSKNDPDLEDSKNQGGNADLEYNLYRNAFFTLGYRYASIEFNKETPDYGEQEVSGGFSWEKKSSLKLSGRWGQAWREIESTVNESRTKEYRTLAASLDIYCIKDTVIMASYSEVPGYISPYRTENDPFISHQLSVNIKRDLLHQKIIIDYSGSQRVDDHDLTGTKDKSWSETVHIAWRILKPALLSLTGSRTKSRYQYEPDTGDENRDEDREDKTWSCGANLEWRILKPVVLTIRGKYTNISYHTLYLSNVEDQNDHALREDTRYEGSCQLASTLYKNISFEMAYQYLKNNSEDKETHESLDDNEYTDHRYSLGLGITF
ncbi:MAG: hypothetical protein AB1847_12590 [bacterium]